MNQLYRVRPVEKKNVEFYIETFERDVSGDYLRGFTARFWYRWGQGFRELDNYVSTWEVEQGVNCEPGLGWGAELDDLVSVWVEFDGEFTEEEQDEIRQRLEGELEDDEGRWGESWIFDGDHNWEIELDEIIIHGPVRIDLVDADGYGEDAIIEEDVAPVEPSPPGSDWPFPTQH